MTGLLSMTEDEAQAAYGQQFPGADGMSTDSPPEPMQQSIAMDAVPTFTQSFWTYLQPLPRTDESTPIPNSGVAPGLLGGGTSGGGTQPSGGILDSFYKWFDDDKTGAAKGAAITVAGSFLQGMFGAKTKARALAAQEKSAEASMMNAQSNADMARIAQTKMENASSIKNTTFGKPAKPPAFKNLLQERQKRAGYGA